MSDTVKLIVTLSKGQYEDLKNIQCGSIGARMIVNAVMNGIPLDDVKQEIWVADFDFGDYYDHTAEIQDKVCGILDNIGKESEEKVNGKNE